MMQAPDLTASAGGGAYASRYRDRGHLNESGHSGPAGRCGTGRGTGPRP
jgi:hypothetical protein